MISLKAKGMHFVKIDGRFIIHKIDPYHWHDRWVTTLCGLTLNEYDNMFKYKPKRQGLKDCLKCFK